MPSNFEVLGGSAAARRTTDVYKSIKRQSCDVTEQCTEIVGIRMQHRSTLNLWLFSLSFLLPIFLFSGCSQDQQDAVRQRRSNLVIVWESYREMHEVAGVSPKASDALVDWMASATDAAVRTKARECLAEGDVIVNWNGNLNVSEGPGRYILAFEAATPARGGYVVMGDGVVKSMTAKQFADAEMLPGLGE